MPLDVLAPGVGVEDEALEDMGGLCYSEELGIRSATPRKMKRRRGAREPAGQGGVGGSIEGRKEKKIKKAGLN